MQRVRAFPWMTYTLWAAGLCNLFWGGLMVLSPLLAFQWAGMTPPNHVELWQYIGLMAGVWGVGYILAAANPLHHWPIVAVGVLWKLLGAAGFAHAASSGRLPWRAGWTVVANDLLWLAPFSLILIRAYQAHLGARRELSPEIQRMALRSRTQYGPSIEELSRLSPVLLVFLRHFGCAFCREAVADLAAQRRAIEAAGASLTLVHMGTEEKAREFFRRYGMEDLPRVSDPHCALYRAFGLRRGSLWDLFGPYVWWRGLQAGLLKGHGAGPLAGDGFQLPGVFLLFHGQVIRSYRHQSAADRPDYVKLASQDALQAG